MIEIKLPFIENTFIKDADLCGHYGPTFNYPIAM